MKLKSVVRFKGEILCVSGLCIGGSSDTLEIGGLAKEVIKNPITKEPYIPGSSLKGKMRSEVEKRSIIKKWDKNAKKWVDDDEKPCGCGKSKCSICKIYGAYKNPTAASAPTRIIVRDAVLSEKSKKIIKDMYSNREEYLERKTENIVLRKSGTAEAPRTIERVPAGMTFDFEIILNIYEGDEEDELIKKVKEALMYVEQSYLGGGGTRGSGQVKFTYDIIK